MSIVEIAGRVAICKRFRLAASLLISLSGLLGFENLSASQTVIPSSQGDSYLSLIVKLHDKGPPELVKATEVPGRLIVRKESSSNFIYEITKDGKTFQVGFIPDPFIVRSFADPQSEQRENIGKAKSATILLNVPDTDAEAVAKGRIGIKFYKLRDGTPNPETMTIPTFKELRSESRVALQSDLGAEALSGELKRTQTTMPE
jgi:hypothetical protein